MEPLLSSQQIFQQKFYRPRENGISYSKYWKIKNCQPGTLYPVKSSFRYEEEIKAFSNKQKVREFINTAAAAAKSLQSCPTLCDPIGGSPPGSSIPGILKARTLEWAAISFSDACTLSRCSHVRLCVTPWTAAHQAPLSTDSRGKNTGVGCHCLFHHQH